MKTFGFFLDEVVAAKVGASCDSAMNDPGASDDAREEHSAEWCDGDRDRTDWPSTDASSRNAEGTSSEVDKPSTSDKEII